MSTSPLAELDARVVRAAGSVKVLSQLAWPIEVGVEFLAGWQRGNPALPRVDYPKSDFSSCADELAATMKDCDRADPLQDFVYRTARSYLRATELLAAAGSSRFAPLSVAIYGSPAQPIVGERTTTAEAAEHLLDATAAFVRDCRVVEEDYCVVPARVAEELRRHAASFDRDSVEIVLDPTLASKAAAGARRVRLRESTCYSEADIPQLVQHELYVHTLTALNGRHQPTLGSLGLGAPRTTRTQEGLALFAELITNSMDINRLRRIAARAVAIDRALGGADFIEVFRYFLEIGQTPGESFASAARVFRGAELRGGSAFTKDGVYFQGLVRVHRFLRDAARDGRVDAPALLMAGRLRIADVRRLEPAFDAGTIVAPRYLPDWIRNRSRLIAFLLYSSLAAELHLDSLIAPGE